MDTKNIIITRQEYDIIAKSRGIQNPQDMSDEELPNAFSRYDSNVYSICRKIRRLGLEKLAKIENMSKNDLNKVKKLQKKAIDELKAIDRLRRIKNFKKLTLN